LRNASSGASYVGRRYSRSLWERSSALAVIGVIGDGSANYAITGLWSAAHYQVPTTFVILRNDEYGVLKWFAGVMKATGLPGMDIPGIDYCAIAQGYGVRAVRITAGDELAAALVRSIASDFPSLIEVPIRATGSR
jgi:benzoylformate decarboxylase